MKAPVKLPLNSQPGSSSSSLREFADERHLGERRVESGSEPGSMYPLFPTLPHSCSLRRISQMQRQNSSGDSPFFCNSPLKTLANKVPFSPPLKIAFFDTFLQFSAFSPTEFFDGHSHRPNSGGQKLVVFERNFWDFNGAQ